MASFVEAPRRERGFRRIVWPRYDRCVGNEDDDRRGYRDELGAAMERVHRLEEENRALRDELEKKRGASRAPAPARTVPAPVGERLRAYGLVALVGFGFIAIASLSARPSHTYVPPLVTFPTFTPMPSFVIPPPPPLYASMEASSATPPTPGPSRKVVELRSSPSGATVEKGGKVLGKTPLFVEVSSASAGACQGGTCSGGTCSGGSCVGEACVGAIDTGGTKVGGTCSGGTCAGQICTGGTCTGQTCPKGFACRGGGTCTGGQCSGGVCAGAGCANGACGGSACVAGSCSGEVCVPGTCEAVTEVVMRWNGERHTLHLGADRAVVGELFLGLGPK